MEDEYLGCTCVGTHTRLSGGRTDTDTRSQYRVAGIVAPVVRGKLPEQRAEPFYGFISRLFLTFHSPDRCFSWNETVGFSAVSTATIRQYPGGV